MLGDDCFICGAKRNSKEFNDEHILPDWILKKYKLHNKFITLPNFAHIEYSKYKIPCCVECNSELGKKIEIPVSKLLKLSYTEICDAIRDDQMNLFLLFRWLMLIFFKTHLKDTSLNWNLNRKEGTEIISDFYDWSEMHHLHCMIRKDYTNASINSKTIGSTFIVPAIYDNSIESFDFVDSKNGLGVMIRLDEFCMISILNDSCGSLNLCQDLLSKINAPLTPSIKRIIHPFCYS